jgi:uncharacterized protein (DUF433 family)
MWPSSVPGGDRSSALQEWLNELTVTSALSRAEVPRTIRRNNHRDTGERTLRRSTAFYLCSEMLSKPRRVFASTSEMRRPLLCHTTAVTSEQLLERITIDPAVCHGQPCIRGTRVLVTVVLDALAAGLGPGEIVAQYPSLTSGDVQAAAAYGAWLAKQEIHSLSAGS